MSRHKVKYRIGCSGYYYSSWKEQFYPEGLPAAKWLPYYSRIFNTVELNGTFYKVPLLKSLKRYVSETPDDFAFSVKMNRFVTHLAKLTKCDDEIKKFSDLMLNGLGKKLDRILFQFPASFQYNEENLEKILLHIVPAEINAIEFRHISWWDAHIERKLSGLNYTFCNTDFPGLEQTFIRTNKFFYARLHGRPELFRSPYSHESLEQIVNSLPRDCQLYHIYFNNTDRGAALNNAQILRDLLNKKEAQIKESKKLTFS